MCIRDSGEIRHLIANGELARETGVPDDHVILAENGTVVDMHAGKAVSYTHLDVYKRQDSDAASEDEN